MQATGKQWAALAEALEGLDIGILVNNVGLSYDHAEFFDRVDEHLAADIVVVNISATNAVRCLVLCSVVFGTGQGHCWQPRVLVSCCRPGS